MNFTLGTNIAQAQRFEQDPSGSLSPYKGDEASIVEGLLRQIASFKLGLKQDKRGNREVWLDCRDQEALIDTLDPSKDQRAFLGKLVLKLRVMTDIEENNDERRLDLYGFENVPDREYAREYHLLGVSATSRHEGSELFGINLRGQLGYARPGSFEYEDVQAIVTSFLPQA